MIKDIEAAVTVLNQGGVLLYPTDTVWGLGCDATNAAAVQRIFEIKQRAMRKSFIVLADSIAQIERYCPLLTDNMRHALRYGDRPQTVILPAVTGLASSVGADDGSVAFRIPKHDFCQALIRRAGYPIVSTSANFSGESTPVTFDSINPKLVTAVDGVVPRLWEKGGTGQPSRILLFERGGKMTVLRD